MARIGMIIPGEFSYPANPLALSGVRITPPESGCTCSGGMGFVSTPPIVSNDVIKWLPWVAAAGVILYVLTKRDSGYAEDVARARRKHPTVAGRLQRAAQAF